MPVVERERVSIRRVASPVSLLSIGTAALGIPYGLPGAPMTSPQMDEGLAVLEAAWRAGINFVDTAPAYGMAEEMVGRAFGSKVDVVISSKVTKAWNDDATVTDILMAMRRSVEATLKLINRSKLDILLLHSPGQADIEDSRVLEALSSIRREGLISAIGTSTYSEQEALAALKTGFFDLLQVAFNLLDQRPMLNIVPEASRRNLAIVTRSSVLKGALTSRWRTLDSSAGRLRREVARIVQALAIQDEELAGMALRFCLASAPPIASVLIGPSNVAELNAALAASTMPMDGHLLALCRTFAIDHDDVLNPSRW